MHAIDFLLCPCIKCGNLICLDINTVKDHMYVHGVMENYTTWVWHGERACTVSEEDELVSGFDLYDGPNFTKMVEDVYREYEE